MIRPSSTTVIHTLTRILVRVHVDVESFCKSQIQQCSLNIIRCILYR